MSGNKYAMKVKVSVDKDELIKDAVMIPFVLVWELVRKATTNLLLIATKLVGMVKRG